MDADHAEQQQIAILLATYNGAAFLREQIDSLFRQDYTAWHLIARDDGSSDATLSILRDIQSRHPDRIAILEDGVGRLGLAGNFGRLLAAADSPWFMPCDQDDVWLPDKLSLFASRMCALERIHARGVPLLLYSDLTVADRDALPVIASYWRSRCWNPARDGQPRALMLRNIVTGCALMGNAALARLAVPIPAEAGFHDWWLALIASAAGHVDFIDRPTVLYRQHGGNAVGARPPGGRRKAKPRRGFSPWRDNQIARRLRPIVARIAALERHLGPAMTPGGRALCEAFLRPRRPWDLWMKATDLARMLLP